MNVARDVVIISSRLGLVTPALRALAAVAATSVYFYIKRPSYFFEQDGLPKIWSIYNTDKVAIETTPIPYWLVLIIIGVSVDLLL